ncbi:gfo/Idh/MocA family oxidoreductase [Iocasia frigidifontis]|uniref:Gfo/Idh/MocA family oxidoreductase n=1 Tax=Iocasia fonsfrigidae TaxID=2682810 RepID=A0A8A7K7E0_9FIRM|nr:Gfo/Idh/MocA family oxidoreductase [Iocasia fonsfrigidae]QTL97693.1 gfo/Idh/MocA family oxidoreductase [Iocasia fonsfrigidae]
MSNQLNFAIIGCGRISKKHIEGIIHNYQEALLTAVSDIVPDKMQQAVNYYSNYLRKSVFDITKNQLKKYQDYQELLNDERVKVVTIATESGYHPQLAIDALNAGKHVIVEKPMALSTGDADRMIELAEKKKLKLAVCHQNRFNPTIQKLRRALDNGRFGCLLYGVASVRWNRNDDYYKMDDWHGTLALDGGILMNQCIHNIDLLQWMLGDVARVYAETDTFLRKIETEDVGLAVVRFNNGSIGLIEGTVCIYPRNLEETFSIFGEKGTVRVSGIAMNQIIDWKFADIEPVEEEKIKTTNYEVETIYGYGHNLLFKDFIRAVKEDRKPLVDGEEGKKAVELILGIYKSARLRQPVQFPLGAYSTTSGVNRNEKN